MAERTTITQVIQLGVETTPGTSVPATRRLQGVSIDPGVKVNVNSFRPQWNKYPTVLTLGREWTEAGVTGEPNYNELPYLLNSVLTDVAPVAGIGGQLGSYTWTYAPSSTAPDAPRTFTVEHGSSVRADKFSNAVMTAFNFSADRTKFNLTGSMLGQAITDGITLTPAVTDVKNIHASAALTAGTYTVGDGTNTSPAINFNDTAAQVNTKLAAATPNPIQYSVTGGPLNGTPVDFVATANTAGAKPAWTVTPTGITGGTVSIVQGTVGSGPTTVPMVPAIPPQIDVFVDNSYAAIGTTKLLRDLGIDFNLDSRFGPLWALNSTLPSYAAIVETAPRAECKLMVEADSQGMGLLTDLRAGNTKYIRFQAQGGNIGASTTPYLFRVDMAAKAKDISAFRDDQGVYAVDFTFDLVDDSTLGGAYRMVVQNALSAL